MPEEKPTPAITAFAADGNFLAILSPNGSVKIWNTSNGSLLAEWNHSDGDAVNYSCMACSFLGKKRKKENATFLLALGTNDGNIIVVNAFTGTRKWKATVHHPGGVVGLAFTDKGKGLYSVGTNGMACEMKSVSGELNMEFKASKKPVSSSAFSSDEKVLVVAGSKMRVLSLENGKELLKFPDKVCPMERISVSHNAKVMVTSGFNEKHLQVWKCDLSSKSVISGPELPFPHSPLVLECMNTSGEKEENLAVLAISKAGVVYVWNMKFASQDQVAPSKITVKDNKTETHQQKGKSAKKSRVLVFAARLLDLEDDKGLRALIAYGSVDSPQFSVVDLSNAGENIVVTAANKTAGKDTHNLLSEATNRETRKRAADLDLETAGDVIDTDSGEAMDGVLAESDVNEPTMGEKLASLNLQENDKSSSHDKQESLSHTKPPSADSVNILLKQALRADDRALLLDCLFTQDEKVIANSISLLNSSDVFKLLQSLLSIIQSRGAILVCAVPWLRNLLLQHSSAIMSQESSLLALNSLYQLIESRVSTFQSAVQLSSCIDFLYQGVIDEVEEPETLTPVIYEDDDESDEQESGDAMDTDQGSIEGDSFHELSDIEGGGEMSE